MEILATIWAIVSFIVVNIYHTVWFLSKLLIYPFLKLYRWIKEKLEFTGAGLMLSDLNDTFYRFNGFIPFCLFIIGLGYSVIKLLMQIGVENGFVGYAETLAFHTPIGFFFSLFESGWNFTPETAVSIAFSSAVFAACMGKEELDDFLGYLIHFLRHIVFFVASAHLAVLLTGVFKAVGDWGYSTIATLFQAKTSSFFPIVGRILLLIILCYPAVELFLLAVKEYTECIILGVLYSVFCGVVSLILQLCFDMTSNIVLEIIMMVVLFGVDLFRPYVDMFIQKYMSERSLYPEGWIEEFGEE